MVKIVCMIGLGGTDAIVKVSGWSTDFTHRHDLLILCILFSLFAVLSVFVRVIEVSSESE